MSEITTRKKINLTTFHAHAGITHSTLEGDAESTSNKTIRTDDIDQATLEAKIESYAYSEPPPAPPTPEQTAIARLRELRTKGWANLTAAEKAEIPQHVLTLMGR